MASKALKGLTAAIAIIVLGAIFASDKTPVMVALIAVASTILMIAVVNYFVKGSTNEVLISGFLLTLIESYHFFIQPNWAGSPELPSSAALFFGVAFAARAIIFLLEIIDNPLKKPVRKVLKHGG